VEKSIIVKKNKATIKYILISSPLMSFSQEYQSYRRLENWSSFHKVIPLEGLIDVRSSLFPLAKKVYTLVRELYEHLPLRKNGEKPFVHPTHVAYFLRKAGCHDLVVLAGLLHDYLEEHHDLYHRDGMKELSKQLRGDLVLLKPLIILLTRENEESYYGYISRIFKEKNLGHRQAAIHIKLADRIHNVLSIETFNGQERIYECFKNLFILNNVKKYLLELYGPQMWNGKINNVTEMLFNKCIKATYDACIHIYHHPSVSGVEKTYTLLQLAFKKFMYLYSGLEAVTDIRQKESHLVKLYLGIVRKYDALLHHEAKEFKLRERQELQFCKRFFKDYHFSSEQLKAILDYKDAYAFKEMLARLLYNPNYFMSLFVATELSRHNRIRKTNGFDKMLG